MLVLSALFFFNDTATTEIYTLSLHDALPIWRDLVLVLDEDGPEPLEAADDVVVVHDLVADVDRRAVLDRKSTRLNSSHPNISYAVFCLKKKKNKDDTSELESLQSI